MGALGDGHRVSAAAAQPVHACAEGCQGSCCKGFWRKVTGQSAHLGSKGGAESIGLFFRGGLPKYKHFGGCGYFCTTFQVVVWMENVSVPRAK